MPYMTVHTAEVEGPLFLRKFGVPFWALARVFGGDPMSWEDNQCQFVISGNDELTPTAFWSGLRAQSGRGVSHIRPHLPRAPTARKES